MELEKLKEISPGGGVKELWAGQLSDDVKEVFERARAELGMGKEVDAVVSR